MVASYLDAVTTLDTHSQAFSDKVDDIRSSATTTSAHRRGVQPAAREAARGADSGGLTEASTVSKSLLEPAHTVEDLDPSRQGDLFSRASSSASSPSAIALRDYFGKYQSSQATSTRSSTRSTTGQDELQKDNAAIEQEKVNLWTVDGPPAPVRLPGPEAGHCAGAGSPAIEATDPERAKVLKEDLLFPVRQKHQDLLTQLAVSVQGYLALDLIRRNNLELIKGVDRATTTTVSALRTAIIVAQALADQKLVLDQITALNTTTGEPDRVDLEMLRQQSGEISKQASSATVDLAKLQHAFQNIYATMDEIDGFKVKALDNIRTTVTALSTEIDKSQTYIDRVRASETRGSGLDAGAGAELTAGSGARPERLSRRCCGRPRCRLRRGPPPPDAERRQHADRDGRLGGQGPRAAPCRHQGATGVTLELQLLGTLEGAESDRRRRGHRRAPGSAAATTCRCCRVPAAASWPRRRSCSARSSSA